MNEKIPNAMKWTGLVIALTGLVAAVTELYVAKAQFERTSIESETELANGLEGLQETILDIESRLRAIEILATRRTVVEFGEKNDKTEPLLKEKVGEVKRKIKSVRVRRPWTQQSEDITK